MKAKVSTLSKRRSITAWSFALLVVVVLGVFVSMEGRASSGDDFNDNSKDTSTGGTDVKSGGGVLAEANQRL